MWKAGWHNALKKLIITADLISSLSPTFYFFLLLIRKFCIDGIKIQNMSKKSSNFSINKNDLVCNNSQIWLFRDL